MRLLRHFSLVQGAGPRLVCLRVAPDGCCRGQLHLARVLLSRTLRCIVVRGVDLRRGKLLLLLFNFCSATFGLGRVPAARGYRGTVVAVIASGGLSATIAVLD